MLCKKVEMLEILEFMKEDVDWRWRCTLKRWVIFFGEGRECAGSLKASQFPEGQTAPLMPLNKAYSSSCESG